MKFIIILLSILTLSACSPVYKTEFSYIPQKKPIEKICIAQCMQSKSTCEQMCAMQNENCTSRSRQDALFEYEMYRSDRERQGRSIDRSLSDFDRSYQCNHACPCVPNYNSCYNACGGEVLERQVCVAFCNQGSM